MYAYISIPLVFPAEKKRGRVKTQDRDPWKLYARRTESVVKIIATARYLFFFVKSREIPFRRVEIREYV